MAKPKNPSYQALKRAVEEHPAPWRVEPELQLKGYRRWFAIFDSRDEWVTTIRNRRLARRIVAAINEREGK